MRPLRSTLKGLGRTAIVSALALIASVCIAAEKKIVALFPTGTSESVMSPQGVDLETAATNAIDKVLRANDRLQVVMFSRANAAVRRALTEGTIPAALLLPPFTGRTGGEYRAVTLGRLMRAQLAVASTVSSYRFARDTKTAHVILTLEAYDITTGKILGVASVSGEAEGEDEKSAAANAIAKAAAAAATEAIDFLLKPPKGDG
ncbi:MAG: hypothetical protein KIT74_00815 [Fimbriimonadales bacterium]|nr:hypothetical protein [Fimbriimonadales bacterium]